jgi:hypothetical protein
MKIANSASPLIVSDGFDPNASIMGMTANAALRMTQHLSETIYTNKQLAVVRESLTNSIDEHIKFKIERSVETGIRDNEGQYEFFARDFAEGLDEDHVRKVFAMYGESKKTHTNELAGGFGIGTGALVSYNNSAIITSCFKGEKKVYSLVRGANDEGFLVGYCYLVYTEPTEETGIEVCVPIQHLDFNKFSNEIRSFVYFSPYNIKANILGEEIKPYPIAKKEVINNIEFTLLNGIFGRNRDDEAILQMGGVKYESFNIPDDFLVKNDHTLVVNVKVGSMTLPLSRESFHDTPLNQNYKRKIYNILEELTQKDFAHIKAKPLKDVIDENLGGISFHKWCDGSMFRAKLASIFKETWNFVGGIAVSNFKEDKKHNFVLKNNKPILVLIPDNSATDYWKSKLRTFAIKNNESYYIGCQSKFSKLSPEGATEIDGIFQTMTVKRFPFPKGKREKTYAVYCNDRKKGSFNAVGFLNLVREERFSLPAEPDLTKLIEWVKEEKKKVIDKKDTSRLEWISIHIGGKSRYNAWSCQSEELGQAIQALGFFIHGRDEHSKLVQGWAKEEQEKNAARLKIAKALKPWLSFNPKTIILIKKEKNADRVTKFWNSILNQQTTRSKIFTSFSHAHESYHSSKPKLTREEFRAVMKMI